MDIVCVGAGIVGGCVVGEDGAGDGVEGRAFGKKAAERDESLDENDDFRVQVRSITRSDECGIWVLVTGGVGYCLLDSTCKLSLQIVIGDGGFGSIDSFGQHLGPDSVPLLRMCEWKAGEEENGVDSGKKTCIQSW